MVWNTCRIHLTIFDVFPRRSFSPYYKAAGLGCPKLETISFPSKFTIYMSLTTKYVENGVSIGKAVSRMEINTNRLALKTSTLTIRLHSINESPLKLLPVWKGDGWSAPRFGRFILGKEQLSIVQEAGWASGPAVGTENRASTGIWPLDCQRVASRYTDCAVQTADVW
jgi:hypothetical protein